MNNILVRLVDMPCSVRGCVTRHFDDDEYYTIMLNSRMSAEMQEKAYLHEMEHINSDDFLSDLSADYIEALRHND